MKKIIYPQNNDVTCLEATINYTIFHLRNGKRVMSSYTLKKHEESPELSSFLRVSRKFLINPDFVEQVRFEKKKRFIVLIGGKELQVSRRRALLF